MLEMRNFRGKKMNKKLRSLVKYWLTLIAALFGTELTVYSAEESKFAKSLGYTDMFFWGLAFTVSSLVLGLVLFFSGSDKSGNERIRKWNIVGVFFAAFGLVLFIWALAGAELAYRT